MYRGFVLACALGLATVASTQPALAQIPTSAQTTSTSSWLTIVPADCQDENGCDICEVTKIFTNAANLISSVLSGLSLLMFVIGGMFMIFSAGNESRVETGKKILVGTVTGLAIIFIAWLGINVLVRTVALSGGTSTNQIFSKNWWELEGCYPALLTQCKGHYVGEACGGGAGAECGAGTVDNPVCSCYRYIDALKPNGTDCVGDDIQNITSVGKAGASSNATKRSCGCFAGCTILAGQTGAAYTCMSEETVTKANDTNAKAGKGAAYTVRTDVSCVTDNTVCALAN